MQYYCFSFMIYVTKQQIMNSNIKIIAFCPFHRNKGCRDLNSAGSHGSCCPEGRESEKIVNSKSKWCFLFWIRIYIMSIIVLARFNFSLIQKKKLFKIPRIGPAWILMKMQKDLLDHGWHSLLIVNFQNM